jgi:hypothetical protein
MIMLRKNILPIVLATLWICLSEFVRNQFLLQSYWAEHYAGMGLTFPSAPVNSIVWGIWSLAFAVIVFFIARKYPLTQTTLIAWFAGFVPMWLATGNLNVLPFGILWYAVPLSMLEAFVASLIIKKTGAGI